MVTSVFKKLAVTAAVCLMIASISAHEHFNLNIPYDTIIDTRDGKTYRTVKIGSLTWMAENLNYQTRYSWCYGNDSSNCAKYGRLYTWAAADRACPAGWRLSTDDDWNNLVSVAGDKEVPGKNLKSQMGWDGIDKFGFSALPGGIRYTSGASLYLGKSGYWWVPRKNDQKDASMVRYRGMSRKEEFVYWDINYGYEGFSVRCVRN